MSRFVTEPGWKLWAWTVVSVVILMMLTAAGTIHVAGVNAQRQVEQERKLREDGRRATCDLVSRILAGYEEVPPPGETGKNVVEAWRDEYRILGCKPIK